MRVCIQAGHQNIQNNIDPGLRSGTGAPGEVSFTIDVANQVSAALRQRGFDLKQTDANANSDPSITQTDWDLFLAIHYEADIHNTNGCFVAAPDPSVDMINQESIRIRDAIAEQYRNATGIPYHPEWQNPNTFYYYMWKALSANTPCVLIECGVGWRVPKDSDILNSDRRSLVVEGIVRGICKAFNIPYDLNTPPVQPPPTPQPADCEQKLVKAKEIIWSKRRTALSELRTLLPR